MAATTRPEPQLQRQLGLASATAIVVGQTIAVGIFLTPAGMARSLASPLLLLAVWLTLGVMTVAGALCYSVLAIRFPETGGTYAYLRHIYGPRLAFLFGWMCLVVMDPGLCAALSMGMAGYVGYLVPLSPIAAKAVAIGTVAAIGALNVLGTRISATFMGVVTWLKVAVLLALPVWALAAHAGSWSHFVPFADRRAGAPPMPMALVPAFVGAFFAFGGWWEISRMGGEIRDPRKNFPRAFLAGVLIVLALYVITTATFIYAVPLSSVASEDAFIARTGEVIFGAQGGTVLAGIVILSIVSSLAAFMMAVPRVYLAMADDGLFVRAAGVISSRFGTPARAIAIQVALACALILLGTFEQIITYFIFTSVLFLGVTAWGATKVYRQEPKLGLGQPAAAVIFAVLVGLLLVLILLGRPLQALLGLAVTAAGALFYPRRRLPA